MHQSRNHLQEKEQGLYLKFEEIKGLLMLGGEEKRYRKLIKKKCQY